MAIDAVAVLGAVKTGLESLALFSEVTIGLPSSSAGAQMMANLFFMPTTVRQPTTERYELEYEVVVEMNYRTDGNVEGAELSLTNAYTAALDYFEHHKSLGGLVREIQPGGPAAHPDYRPLAGEEQRVLPLFLKCVQRGDFPAIQPSI